MESAIINKGRLTIPKAIRKYLQLKSGSRIKFFVHPDGSVALLPTAARQRTVTVEAMREAAAAGANGSAAPRTRR